MKEMGDNVASLAEELRVALHEIGLALVQFHGGTSELKDCYTLKEVHDMHRELIKLRKELSGEQ